MMGATAADETKGRKQDGNNNNKLNFKNEINFLGAAPDDQGLYARQLIGIAPSRAH